MTTPFRLGIIGTGQITEARHLPAALATPNVEVVALVDSDVGRAQRLVQKFGLSAVAAGQVDDVLSQVDGAVIATPNFTHEPLALKLIAAGKPVLIEKPIASTSESGRRIVAASESAGVPVAVGYATRFDPRMRLLKELFDSRYFGRVSRFVYQLGMADWGVPASGYTLRASSAGGGVLIVNGSHFVDRMLWWFGTPAQMEYTDDSAGGPECRSELRVTYIDAGSEMTGCVRITKDMKLVSGFAAETESGTVIVPDDGAAAITLRPNHRPAMEIAIRPDLAKTPTTDVFRLQLENFINAVRGTEPLLVDGAEGLRSLALIETAYAERRPLAIDLSRAVVGAGR